VRLSDVNGDLIGCYRTVRDRTDAVIAALARLAADHRARGAACYYEVRDALFNPRRLSLTRDGIVNPDGYTPDLAAMLIYLNRTGFNGLFRLNRQGGFNVPVGRYDDPRICDRDHLHAVAAAFRRADLTIAHQPFTAALSEAGQGDFVYCDPPYEPLSRSSSFANYTAGGFTMADQEQLQRAVVAACRRGAHVVVSNSSAPSILKAYTTASARAARLAVMPVPARRSINARSAGRGVVDELIISNVAPPKLRMAKAGAPAARRKTA
jgi:DNA adenine methylase